jgi:hypothetical protein
MFTQISNTHNGYIVKVYTQYNSTLPEWHSIINFGNRQSDAIEFEHLYLQNLSWSDIHKMIADYQEKDICMLKNVGGEIRYIKESNNNK